MVRLLLVLALMVPVSFAQMNVGEIAGVVTDPAGDVIVAASVTARNTATGLQANTNTSQSGEYRLSGLAPGIYTVSATAQGFKQAIQENAPLHAGERIDLNFSMVLGQRTETLIVEEFPGALQSELA